MSKIATIVIFFLVSISSLKAQFAGPVGTLGTTAMYKDSNVFIAWASNCSVTRGYQDVSNPSLGYAATGDNTMALGKAGTNGVVSLGDGGNAILTFQNPIANGTGFDFAVFENGFNDLFLELAFVEVSSDGVNYFRFPATSKTQITTQIGPFDEFGDATKINNLAGKYRANYGTPFDLDELSGIVGLDINSITHVKIIDVVGSVNPQFASLDVNNNPINDPFPTAFESCGFDLDAVGVIHQKSLSINDLKDRVDIAIYPNPVSSGQNFTIKSSIQIEDLTIFNTNGILVYKGNIENFSSENLSVGIYMLHALLNNVVVAKKIIVL